MSNPEPPFALTEGERHHPLWLRLSAHLTEKLARLRSRNDGALSEQETATIRGEINCVKRFIALGDEPPQDG
jgi:hypothetical protein